MNVTRSSVATMKGPAEWFTGEVYVDQMVVPEGVSEASASLVHFSPGARTAWHTHPKGQTIFVTEGVGRCQKRGGEIEELRPGDSVFFEPGEEHWHGAAPHRFMAHVAVLQQGDDGTSADWGEHVSDEEYGG